MEFLTKYPKNRPDLPVGYIEAYEDHYSKNRGGVGLMNALSQYVEGWMHRVIAVNGRAYVNCELLDFGCGNLNHFKYEKNYKSYDAVEPYRKLIEGSSELANIRNLYSNSSDIKEKTYDRVLSVAVLEHLPNLPLELCHLIRLMKVGGVFQAGIPCEGEWAWDLGWKLSTGRSFKRAYGLDFSPVMKFEHVNSMSEIIDCVQYFFADVTYQRSPFPFPIKGLSFYAYIEARKPILSRVEDYLATTLSK